MSILPTVTGLVSLCSLAYVAFSVYRVARFGRRRWRCDAPLPPVTVLKPLCGQEAELYENLRSFCVQDYPRYQVLFGVADAGDPALDVVHRLLAEFPDRDLDVVVSDQLIGGNRKVSNVANLYPRARHDILVIADSDMRVDAGYLRAVTAGFADADTGAVTCLYRGRPAAPGIASILGSAFINEWFLPSVLVAASFGDIRYCFGATMAVRRSLLERVGGFPALASHLADDYLLGKLVSDQGCRVELSPYVVENLVSEPDLKSLFRHELRWARTVRSVQPLGYTLSVVTHALPVCILYLAVTATPWLGIAAVAAALALRVLMQCVTRRSLRTGIPVRPWLVPLRDFFSFAVWAASFFGNNVSWRRHSFAIDNNGNMVLNGHKETL